MGILKNIMELAFIPVLGVSHKKPKPHPVLLPPGKQSRQTGWIFAVCGREIDAGAPDCGLTLSDHTSSLKNRNDFTNPK